MLSNSCRRSAAPHCIVSFSNQRVLRWRVPPHQRHFKRTGNTNNGQIIHEKYNTAAVVEPPPTRSQLRAHFWASALRMMGFGAMDMTVMLQAGHAIDMSLGVTFGLSTLTAAALGELCSSSTAVLFGGTLERLAKRSGCLPRSGLTATQRALPVVTNASLLGALLGVFAGCCLGMTNLLFMDTDKTLKLKAKELEGQELAFEVYASNEDRQDATVFTVRGPDVDGVLAAMTTALANLHCSLVELNAHRTSDQKCIEDTFVVVRDGKKIPKEKLGQVARLLLDATHAPIKHNYKTEKQAKPVQRIYNFKAHATELEKLIQSPNIQAATVVGCGVEN